MMPNSKIFRVLIVSLSLIAFTGDNSLVMASSSQSHATHFVSLKGPQLAQEEAGCYVCHAAGDLQCQGYGPVFADMLPLELTQVCDPCHSPEGTFPGGHSSTSLSDPDIGAKANWHSSVYTSQYEEFPLWQQNTEYETGDIVMHGDPALMYVAKNTFTSGASFLLDNWTKILNVNWAIVGCAIGDLFSSNGQVYRSRIKHIPDMELLPENWELVKRTGAGKEVLQEGKEYWCATCHDDQPAYSKADLYDPTGVKAPKVLGDDSTYGFYVSGHGRPGIDQQCLDCHNSTFAHIDDEHRTYETHLTLLDYVKHAYKDSYRLKEAMRIPMFRDYDSGESIADAMAVGYNLCMKTCHEPHAGVLSEGKYCETNFREGTFSVQYHTFHLSFVSLGDWDSDWEGTAADSSISCPACHNVHGSPMMVNGNLKPNPVMIRHGELISTPDTQDRVPTIDYRWFTDGTDLSCGNGEETNILEESQGGDMCDPRNFSENLVCYTCHSNPGTGTDRIPGCDPEILDGTDMIIWTTDTDPDNTVKTEFYPGEGIRYHLSFYLTGAVDGTEYCIKSENSGAYNLPDDSVWKTHIVAENVPVDVRLSRGQHTMYWERTIPLEAQGAAPGTARYRMELKMGNFDCTPFSNPVSEVETLDFTIAKQGETDPPVRPTLTPQADTVAAVAANVTLEWSEVLCPDGDTVQYYVKVDDSSDFSSPEHTLEWKSQTSWVPPSLPTGATWHWRVQARDSGHTDRESPWSYPDSFDIYIPLESPDLTHELDTSDPVPAPLELEWSPVACPDGHGIEYYPEISDTSDFSSNNYSSGWQSDTSWDVLLPMATTWYWRVKARDAYIEHIDHESAWSTTDSFVIYGTPSTPTLIPEDDVESPIPLEVTLEWLDDVTCPDGHDPEYRVQVSDCANFGDAPCTKYSSEWQPEIGWGVTLDPTGTWYWRVQARDSVDTLLVSAWSETDSFAVNPYIINESYEGAGYEETWVETIASGCSLDEDYAPIPGADPPGAGLECLRAVSDAPGYQAMTKFDHGTPQAKTFTSLYFLVGDEDLPDDQRKTIGVLQDNAGNAVWGLILYKGSGQLKFNLYLYNNGAWGQVFQDIALNTWYRIDIKYDDTDDTWEWRFNGITQHSGSLTGTHYTNIQNWAFGFTDPVQHRTATVYFDKITVSTESFD